MPQSIRRFSRIALIVAVGAAGLSLNEGAQLSDPQTLMSTSQARIGRPATPLSYAGAARRTTRRAVAAGTAAGAAAYGAARCYRAVDAYGRAYTRCY